MEEKLHIFPSFFQLSNEVDNKLINRGEKVSSSPNELFPDMTRLRLRDNGGSACSFFLVMLFVEELLARLSLYLLLMHSSHSTWVLLGHKRFTKKKNF